MTLDVKVNKLRSALELVDFWPSESTMADPGPWTADNARNQVAQIMAELQGPYVMAMLFVATGLAMLQRAETQQQNRR